ncbi:MAG: hypothetical protein HY615_05665 [Candidatus Rokubacteria bacterium]|nr:hypothetical protein [Candidatus Rokubacteria bacterium]
MTRARPRLRLALLVAGAATLLGTPAPAQQPFHLGAWDGSLDGVSSFRRTDTESPSQRSRSDNPRSEERLNLRNTGAYIFDPRLVTLSLGGSFGLFQDELTVDGDNRESSGTLLGYDAFLSLLSEQPFSLTAFASRNESSESRELSGRSELVTENRGAILSAKRLYLPSTLSFRQELQDEESQVGSTLARRKDERRIVSYRGQRGWVDSDMEIFYEFVDDADQVFPALSFQSHEAQLNYGLDFGVELNRHWDSRLRWFTRSGLVESDIWTADESLRIDHTERLRTDYRYLLVRTAGSAGTTTTQTALASLRHRLYESLTTVAGLDAVRQDLPRGEKDSYRGRSDLTYTKTLPLGGRLTAGLGGSLQYEDDRFETTETSVGQESHTAATPVALPIALDNAFVITSSVVVTKIAFGPIPLGCVAPPGPPTPLVLGQDYTLRTVNDVTEIVPIPCAGVTPGINPGDTIAVDYRFAVTPSLTFTTTTWHANLGVDYRWIRVFGSHEESDQSLVAGRDSRFLSDQQSDGVGAELRYDGARVRASLLGEARRFTSTRTSYDSLRASTFEDFTILPSLLLRLSADRTVTTFHDQDRETRTQSARAALSYRPLPGLVVDASVAVRRFEDTAQPTEQQTEGRLLARWILRKLEFAPSFEYFERRRGETTTTEYRAMLKTVRRF